MQYKEKYDVVIIGAGPGGLRSAEVLGLAGKSVLLIERKDIIGPKICAGGLTRKAIIYLNKIGLSKKIIEQEFDGLLFRINTFKTRINFGETFLYTIKRENLGQWQVEKLNSLKNVTVCTGDAVTKITKESIVINQQYTIKYEYLIGADGSNSMVRKFLGLDTKLFGVAYQYMISTTGEYDDIEIILDSHFFHAWYGWIFPYKNVTSVGAGYFPKIISAKESMNNFDKWLQKEKIDIKNAKIEAHPINCDYQGFHFDNIFLVGDAAGFASGFTGEGIYQAIISGDEVAKIILDEKYESKMISEILYEKKIHEILLKLLIMAGPLRNMIFYLVVLFVKIPWCGKTLLRVLS
jgi:geranylgeranyl reductase